MEKTLKLGKIEGKRKRGWQRMRWLDSITYSMDMNLSELQEIVKDGGAWHAAVHEVTKSRTRLSDSTTTKKGRVSKSNSVIVKVESCPLTKFTCANAKPRDLRT